MATDTTNNIYENFTDMEIDNLEFDQPVADENSLEELDNGKNYMISY